MTETDRMKIKPLESGDDYRLWKIRVEAACDAKNLDDVLIRERNPNSDPEKKAKFESDMRKASGIIVAALTNEPLRIFRTEVGKPYRMLKKLNERYDSKSAASRISKMIELISLRYDNLSKDIGCHIDKMAGIVEQLAGMNTSIPNEPAIALLIASIHVPDLAPIAAAIKTMSDEAATWDAVTTRLIEEQQSLKIRKQSERATTATKHCEICEGRHFTKDCWLNPRNSNNRLKLQGNQGQSSKDGKSETKKKKSKGSHKKHGDKRKDSTDQKQPRAAVAKANICNTTDGSRMMLDSGTTTHMTPDEDELQNTENCNVSISLGDDSSVQARKKGMKPVTWCGQHGNTDVHLTETLAARDLAMRLLSVPALTKKGMAVVFLPRKALIVDLRDNFDIIGIAPKAADGLYYISADGSDDVDTSQSTTDRAMMAVVRQFTGSCDTSEDFRDKENLVDQELTSNSQNDVKTDESDTMDSDCSIEGESSSSSESDTSSSTDDEDGLDDMPQLLVEDEDMYDFSDDEDGYSSIDDGSDFSGSDSDSEASKDSSFHEDSDDEIAKRTDLCGAIKPAVTDTSLWHSRLGHQGKHGDLQKKIAEGTLPPASQFKTDCEPCTKGKFKRFFRGSLTKDTQPGKIHADLVGRIKPSSSEGYEYFMTIVDEATKYAETVPLRKKSDASAALLSFMTRFERQSGVKLRSLHVDDGSEFFKARSKFEEMGLKVTTSSAYTPSSNGLVERTQGVLLSAARTCLNEAQLPLNHWCDALEHVTKGRNVVVHTATGKPPYTALFGQNADYVKHMRPFGSRVLVQPVKKKLAKFESRMIEGVCLGHVDGGVYKVLTANGTIKTKHVRFIESAFPGTSLLNNNSNLTTTEAFNLEIEGYSSDEEPELTTLGGRFQQLERVTHYPARTSSYRNTSDSEKSDDSDDPDWEPVANAALPREISTSDEPSVAEAMRSSEAKQWQTAIEDEFKVLEEAGTWTKLDNPPCKSLPTDIVLRLKRDEDGLPSKFKASLVARGNLQRSSKYTQENKYVPVACFDIVRILLALSAAFGWERQQVDIKGAFLHSSLPSDTDIWIKLPFIDGIPAVDGSIVKLLKSLYGLKEAPKLWYQNLAFRLIEMGCKQLASSDCVFIMLKNGEMVIILVYVDDLGLFGHRNLIKFVKQKLSRYFRVTDLGESTFFLGVSILETTDSIFLSQRPLIQRIIEQANMQSCKPTRTPLPSFHILYEARCEPSDSEMKAMKGIPYREVLGSLLFLSTRTRPDISAAVSMLGKFAASPLLRHWNMMKHVIRYLKGTPNHGLKIDKGTGYDLQAYSDADWARDEDKRRSRTGILITIRDNPVTWTSKLQPTVALSTSEAEFYALSECIREVNWIRQLYDEVGLRIEKPTTVFQDNLGAITWTEEVQGLRKVKHVRIRYHFVKEAVQNKDVEVLYIPSLENKADPFTKAIVGSLFNNQRKEQKVMTLTSAGGVSDNDK